MTVPYELQIIHVYSGVQLFSYRFREDIQLDPSLIAGFMTAVISFAEEMKPSEGKEIIKFIDRGDFVLQVERGELVVGLLILSRKDYSFRDKLRILVSEFERRYYKQIKNWSGISSNFLEFKEQVTQLISRKPLSPYHIPRLIDSDRAPRNLDDIKWSIITRINGQNDINAISEELDISVEVVQSIIAYFEEVGLVETSFILSENCVIELTKRGVKALEIDSEAQQELLNLLGEEGLKVISIVETGKGLLELKSELLLSQEEVTQLVEKLISEKYLEIIPEWKVALDKKAFQFTRTLEFIEDLFELIFDESNRWLGLRELERIRKDTIGLTLIKDKRAAKMISEYADHLIDYNSLKKLLSEGERLTELVTHLEPVFNILLGNLEREIGSNLTKDIMYRVGKRLEGDYSELISEQEELVEMLGWLA